MMQTAPAKLVTRASTVAGKTSPRFKLVPISSFRVEKTEWLWPGRIPLGELTILAGSQGLGKSYFAHYLAAKVSGRPGPWPDGSPVGHRGGVIILDGGENDEGREIRKRLIAMSAHEDHIDVPKPEEMDDAGELLDLGGGGLAELERMIAELGGAVRLVVLDAIDDFFPGVDADKNRDVRLALHPLVSLARRHGLAVVGIKHLGKPRDGQRAALAQVIGSTAWTAVPRSVLIVAQDKTREDGKADRLLAFGKLNVGRPPPNIGFHVGDDGDLHWRTDVADTGADELLGSGASAGGVMLKACRAWLLERLGGGPILSGDLDAQAVAAGFTVPTLKNARKDEKANVKNVHAGGPWVVCLAGQVDAARAMAKAHAAKPQPAG